MFQVIWDPNGQMMVLCVCGGGERGYVITIGSFFIITIFNTHCENLV